jgi:hypothetical protein
MVQTETIMKPLKGKVAIVTGAGRPKGIGRASALRLSEHGAGNLEKSKIEKSVMMRRG